MIGAVPARITNTNRVIYRSAKTLIDQHSEDAGLEAAMRADKLLAKGDMEGKRAWVWIMKAVEELQRTEPAPRRCECQVPSVRCGFEKFTSEDNLATVVSLTTRGHNETP